MCDFSEFLSQIDQLEKNVIIPIEVDQDLDSIHKSDFMASGYQNSRTKSDLNVYLTILQTKSHELDLGSETIKMKALGGLPTSFFKHSAPDFSFEVPKIEAMKEITVAPDSKPSLSEILATADDNTLVSLKPGGYKGTFVISKNIALKSDGSAYFDSQTDCFIVECGNVLIDGVQIRSGSFCVNDGNVYILNSKFLSTLCVQGNVICKDTKFNQNSRNCATVSNSGSLTLEQCVVNGKGINISNGNLVIKNSKIESINGNALQIDGGDCYIDDTSIGDTTKSVISCNGRSNSTFTKCSIFDSENENLLNASNGAIVDIKGGSLSGHSKAAIVSSNGAAVKCKELKFNKPVITNNSALLYLLDCEPLIVFSKSSHLLMENCKVIASPRSGLVSVGDSQIQIQNSVFSNCAGNGIELSNSTVASIFSSRFTQNNGAGALISSISSYFLNCIFESNTIVGCQIKDNKAHPIFENCNFVENITAGVTILEGTYPQFTHCQFRKNEQYGDV